MIDPESGVDLNPILHRFSSLLIEKLKNILDTDPDIIEVREEITALGYSFQVEDTMAILLTKQPVPIEEQQNDEESEAKYEYEEVDDDDEEDEDDEYAEEDEDEDDTPREPISSEFTEADRVRLKALRILLPEDESPK